MVLWSKSEVFDVSNWLPSILILPVLHLKTNEADYKTLTWNEKHIYMWENNQKQVGICLKVDTILHEFLFFELL